MRSTTLRCSPNRSEGRSGLALVLRHAESRICWGSEMIQNCGLRKLLNGVSSAGRRLVPVHSGRDVEVHRGRSGGGPGNPGPLRRGPGTGKKTAGDGTARTTGARPGRRQSKRSTWDESPEEKIARLEAEVAEERAARAVERAENAKLSTERDILRSVGEVSRWGRRAGGVVSSSSSPTPPPSR